MPELLGYLIGGLLIAVTTASLLTILIQALPGFMERLRHTLDNLPGRAFAVGLVNFIFFSLIAAIASQIGESTGGFFGGLFTLTALCLVWILLLLLTIGTAGILSRLVQNKIPPTPTQTWRMGLLLILALLTPLIGWFVIGPLILITGLGATIVTGVLQLRSPKPETRE